MSRDVGRVPQDEPLAYFLTWTTYGSWLPCYQPFHVRMADGCEIQVTHPNAVAWHPDTPRIAVFIVPGGGWEIVDVALITSLGGQARVEPIEENGQNPNGGE